MEQYKYQNSKVRLHRVDIGISAYYCLVLAGINIGVRRGKKSGTVAFFILAQQRLLLLRLLRVNHTVRVLGNVCSKANAASLRNAYA